MVGWGWKAGWPLPLLGLVPCGTLQRTKVFILTLKHLRLELCDFHYTGQTLTGESRSRGHRQDQRPASVTRRKPGLGAPRGREQLILHPRGIGKAPPQIEALGLDFELQVEVQEFETGGQRLAVPRR